MKAFSVMGRTLKSTYEELFLVIVISLLWWVGLLLIVTSPLATMGVQTVANRIANYKRVNQSFFWEGARTQTARGVALFLLWLLVPPIMWFSIQFYLDRQGWLALLGIVLAWAMLITLMAGQYMYALLLQQSEPSLKLTLRNAVVLAFRHPLFSVLMLLFQLALTAVSVMLVIPVVILLPGMLAIAQNQALIALLQNMGLAPQPPVMSGT
ncbi:MAG: hypothetical protein IPK16_02320 [Anaerolineales bacterium]|nr:hypothetical protein [Anaerolineales bacterium]